MEMELVLDASMASGFTTCRGRGECYMLRCMMHLNFSARPTVMLSKCCWVSSRQLCYSEEIRVRAHCVQQAECCSLDSLVLSDGLHHGVRVCQCLRWANSLTAQARRTHDTLHAAS